MLGANRGSLDMLRYAASALAVHKDSNPQIWTFTLLDSNDFEKMQYGHQALWDFVFDLLVVPKL